MHSEFILWYINNDERMKMRKVNKEERGGTKGALDPQVCS